jgi:hypothetical protein
MVGLQTHFLMTNPQGASQLSNILRKKTEESRIWEIAMCDSLMTPGKRIISYEELEAHAREYARGNPTSREKELV